ncbi:MAG: ABC-F family ATP-binding cassette domain-containing protein [Thermoflexaceae bacterium]|nr:ABC-F family ATP-binding cassette domain-containing protein [Thermoflexaceae bacterium]
MNILNVEKVTKGYGSRILLDEVTLGVNDGDKIGVIGVNGTGKSTFLKIVAGLEAPDQGKVVKGNGITVSYLPQNPVFQPEDTIIGYVCKGKSYKDGNRSVESEAKTVLNRLGIFHHEQPVEQLSGGQKKRVALARTLIAPSDILVMDEPTNHLDNDMVLWLENFLNKFKGQLIMVTHDRYFLDRVTNRIVEIDRGHLYGYDANYSGFLKLKAQREEMELATEKKRQNILRNELAWISRGCQARSTKQQARIDRYEDMKEASRAARASFEKGSVEMSSISTRIGKKTIEINHISKSYEGKVLIGDFSHIVLRDERIGIIGPNGCGKSTLLKIICGMIPPDSGSVEIGDTIKIGCFMQENEILDESINVIEHVKNIGEYVTTVDGKITASQMCEKFLFTPNMQYTPISKLSGGEKRRLYLLSVLMESPNVLILDEPTNDLDIETLTILEDYLDNFAGMVITVSHDRYFLDRIVDRIFAFEGNGVISQYEGGFSDYLEKARAKGVINQDGTLPVRDDGLKNNREKWKADKQRQHKLKFTYAEQKEFESIDDEIAKLEEQQARIDADILKFATDSGKLNELVKEKALVDEALEEKMERWVYLNELAEKIASQ